MGKSFFEHQQLARRNTRVMVVLFLLSVAAIILGVNLVVGTVYLLGADDPAVRSLARVPRPVYLWGALVTFAIIAVVSLVNIVKLAGGGAKVAELLGGRRVAPNTQEPLERRLVNIVEEMSIASGVRLPQVYVLDKEQGINAFAAGWSVSGAVVAVTRGTLERLTRDELQGVIGHEFSHILNGDMSLNIRMIGVLAGIVAIGSIGGFMMRNAFEADDIRAAIPIFLVGLAIFTVGYTGLFFARLIKAAVSREREFLADASSVQFTRNPDGIAGALDQIRQASAGALIHNRYAEDMSHLFFGQSVRMRLAGMFDTHPPLEERIRRVRPGFQSSRYRAGRPAVNDGAGAGAAGAAGFAGEHRQGRRASDTGVAWGRTAGESAGLVGTLDAGKVDFAARLLGSLPAPLREGLRDPAGAAAAVVALLLAPQENVATEQLAEVPGPLADAAREVAKRTRSLGPAFHLPVIDLALPALKAAPEEMKQELLKALEAVAHADRRVSLHEFVVLTLVRTQLAPKQKGPAPTGKKLADLHAEAALLLNLVVHAGRRADATGERHDSLEQAFAAGAREMGLDIARPLAAITLPTVGDALAKLNALLPLEKARLVKGLFAASTADGEIRVAEAELMRLVGAVLDCPLPPLLQELDPATLAA